MCLITLAIWILLFIVSLISISVTDGEVGAIVALVSIGLGVVLPVIVNYWRPLFFRWAARRNKLEERLLSDGVLTKQDIEKGARAVEIREVKPGSSRTLSGSKQRGFILLDGKTLRILGVNHCYSSDSYSVIPGCTGRCSKCWVIWACGGDSFRVRMKVEGTERDFLIRCFEGRTLSKCAHATEMIEELIESEKSVDAAPAAAAQTEATPEAPVDVAQTDATAAAPIAPTVPGAPGPIPAPAPADETPPKEPGEEPPANG